MAVHGQALMILALPESGFDNGATPAMYEVVETTSLPTALPSR